MRRRLVLMVAAAVAVMAVFTIGKAVLNAASEPDVGTPSTSELLPLPPGLAMVAETTFASEGSLGGGTRVLVLDGQGGAEGGAATAAAYLDALETRGWERASSQAAIALDQSFCVVADAVGDFLADPLSSERMKEFVNVSARDINRAAVVTAGIC